MKHIITFDVGTTSVKTCLFNQDLQRLAERTDEYELITPEENIVESDPSIYINASKSGISWVLKTAGVAPESVAAFSVTSQGETLIPVDESGTPIRNSIVWLDSRAEEQAELINAKISSDELYARTGNAEATGAMPAAKLMWIKQHEPEIYEKTHKFLLIADFLRHFLCGSFATDNIMSCSTGYFDIRNNCYYDEMFKICGIEKNKLPQVIMGGEIQGCVTKELCDEFGFSPETAVVCGGMDQVASALGSGNFTQGIVTETTGTALVIACTVDEPDFRDPAKIAVYPHFGGKYLLLPYCPNAAIVQKWFKEQFCSELTQQAKETGVSEYAQLDSLAETVAEGSGGLIVFPNFSGMLSPKTDLNAKGVFFGVTLETKKPHFARAILEAIAFMLRENLELLQKQGYIFNEIRSMGGGSKSRIWNQIKADVTGIAINTLKEEQTTSLGCAMLAAAALGWFSSLDEAIKVVGLKHRFEPRAESRRKYEQVYSKYIRIYPSLQELFKPSSKAVQ